MADENRTAETSETVAETKPLTYQSADTPVAYHTAEGVAEAFDNAIGPWIDQHLRGSPVSGATEAWNHLMGKLDHLKSLLLEQLKAKE